MSGRVKISDKEFFWQRVARTEGDFCWIWTGARYPSGYGEIRKKYAHRFSLELATGIPLGKLHALHTCDNPCCVNPNHLYAGTDADNRRDARDRMRFKNGGRSGSILTAEQVREIRRRAQTDLASLSREKAAMHLAKSYPVTHFAIRDIIAGTRWSHIT